METLEPSEQERTQHLHSTDLAQHRRHLSRQVRAALEGGPVSGGRLWGLPELPDGDAWADIAGASILTGREPRTITSYLARGNPRRNPFPPAHRILYRLYWPVSELRAWLDRER